MNDVEFMAALGGESREFDGAAGWLLRRKFASTSEHAAFVAAAVRTLASSALRGREIDRRCRVVIDSVRHDEGLLKQVVAGVQGVQPSALNAVRGALPSHLRPLAVVRAPDEASPSSPGAVAETSSPAGDEGVRPQVETKQLLRPTVVLVGTQVEHSNNVAMLKHSGFDHTRVPTLQTFWDVDSTGFCGFVIAPSAWADLDEASQRAAVERLCARSTFTFARLALNGMAASIASSIPSLAKAAGRSPDRFCHGDDGRLTAADIALLRASAALLQSAYETRFVPLDILEGEALLMCLVAAHHCPFDGAVEVRRLGAAPLTGGKSGARVFMLQMKGDPSRRFVVKLDEISRLRAELDRYQRWIASWEPNVTDPILHRHEGRAAISYRLQAHADSSDRAAPKLESELDRLRGMEWLEDVDGSISAADLAASLQMALCRAADRLAQLNKRPANGKGEELWLHWPMRDLATRGVKYEVEGHDHTVFDLSTVLDKASQQLAPLHDVGVVHGDIHGQNILLIDRLPAFIDYDRSGPGNPLLDLVRLDATVRHTVMRATIDEKALVAVFVAVYVDGEPLSALVAQHASIAASPTCKLALSVAEKTRASALDVAKSFGHGLREYLAMVAVVASYTLALRTPGSAVERAVLAAVAPFLMGDEAVPWGSRARPSPSGPAPPDLTVGSHDA